MQSHDQRGTRGSALLNVLAVAAPSLCIAHCLGLPLLLAFLPILGLQGILFGMSEKTISLLVVPLCALGIVPGYVRHRKMRVVLIMLAGMILVLLGSFAADGMLRPGAEVPVTVLGSLFLISAALSNIRLSAPEAVCRLHRHAREDIL